MESAEIEKIVVEKTEINQGNVVKQEIVTKEIIKEVTIESKQQTSNSQLPSKAFEKEMKWRITNLPPHVEPKNELSLEQFNQQQSTQQAQKYKSKKFNPLTSATWQPGEP